MLSTVDFTPADLEQLEQHGISPGEAHRQLQLLREHPPAMRLVRPCTVGDGIIQLDQHAPESLLAAASRAAEEGRVMKFVPASGAATRMFKDLIGALAHPDRPSATAAGRTFFERLDDFPFSVELRRRSGVAGAITSGEDERRVLETLLAAMRYAELPKALIPFHRSSRIRTPLEEHLLEGLHYTTDSAGVARTHFTVAPEFRQDFAELVRLLRTQIREMSDGATVEVTFSEQRPSTDTLALADNGRPFRTADGRLLLRPAGHGALLGNLEALGGDVIVIKNIDNAVPYERSGEVVEWKRRLIGYAVTLQARAAACLTAVGAAVPDAAELDAAIAFARSAFGHEPPRALHGEDAKVAFVTSALDRPLRVCGVVRNEGEPGGAPFWVADEQGAVSAQIVETSQVALNDPEQRQIFAAATHFNPVDIVCAVRRHDGRPYDLTRFVDESAVFLSKKSHDGRELAALERPGLWNGGMAGWNTSFVEVPASTFAPVKTVFDLLRPQHQSS